MKRFDGRSVKFRYLANAKLGQNPAVETTEVIVQEAAPEELVAVEGETRSGMAGYGSPGAEVEMAAGQLDLQSQPNSQEVEEEV